MTADVIIHPKSDQAEERKQRAEAAERAREAEEARRKARLEEARKIRIWLKGETLARGRKTLPADDRRLMAEALGRMMLEANVKWARVISDVWKDETPDQRDQRLKNRTRYIRYPKEAGLHKSVTAKGDDFQKLAEYFAGHSSPNADESTRADYLIRMTQACNIHQDGADTPSISPAQEGMEKLMEILEHHLARLDREYGLTDYFRRLVDDGLDVKPDNSICLRENDEAFDPHEIYDGNILTESATNMVRFLPNSPICSIIVNDYDFLCRSGYEEGFESFLAISSSEIHGICAIILMSFNYFEGEYISTSETHKLLPREYGFGQDETFVRVIQPSLSDALFQPAFDHEIDHEVFSSRTGTSCILTPRIDAPREWAPGVMSSVGGLLLRNLVHASPENSIITHLENSARRLREALDEFDRIGKRTFNARLRDRMTDSDRHDPST